MTNYAITRSDFDSFLAVVKSCDAPATVFPFEVLVDGDWEEVEILPGIGYYYGENCVEVDEDALARFPTLLSAYEESERIGGQVIADDLATRRAESNCWG